MGNLISGPPPDQATVKRLLLHILLWSLAFKVFLSLILPLGLDEAYAIAVARDYSLSFFDHPPLSFWMPVAMADLTGIEHRMVFRAPFLLAGVLTTWVMFLIGREVGGDRVGLWSALLYALAPFFTVSAGFLAVPDGPLNLFSALAVLGLVRIATRNAADQLILWLGVGMALALALASKYQAAWIPVAAFLFMLIDRNARRWFLMPGPWLAGVVGLLGLAPVLLWNMQNDWISFSFHTSRAGGGLNPKNLGFMLFGQGLFLLPTALVAAVAGLKLGLFERAKSSHLLLALMALGPILLFNYVYFTSTRSHAHWAMPGWQFAIPLAALWIVARGEKTASRTMTWSKILLPVIWVPLITLVIHANTGLLTRFTHETPPDWDYTLSIFDFKDLEPALRSRGLWDETDVFMGSSWAFAGILDTFLGAQKPMRVRDLAGAHHFVFMEQSRATGRVLYMEPTTFRDKGQTDARMLAEAQKLDPMAELLPPIILQRGGIDYVRVSLVRLTLNE